MGQAKGKAWPGRLGLTSSGQSSASSSWPVKNPVLVLVLLICEPCCSLHCLAVHRHNCSYPAPGTLARYPCGAPLALVAHHHRLEPCPSSALQRSQRSGSHDRSISEIVRTHGHVSRMSRPSGVSETPLSISNLRACPLPRPS